MTQLTLTTVIFKFHIFYQSELLYILFNYEKNEWREKTTKKTKKTTTTF